MLSATNAIARFENTKDNNPQVFTIEGDTSLTSFDYLYKTPTIQIGILRTSAACAVIYKTSKPTFGGLNTITIVNKTTTSYDEYTALPTTQLGANTTYYAGSLNPETAHPSSAGIVANFTELPFRIKGIISINNHEEVFEYSLFVVASNPSATKKYLFTVNKIK